MKKNDEGYEQVFISLSDHNKRTKSIVEHVKQYGTLPDLVFTTHIVSMEELIEKYGFPLTLEESKNLEDGRTK